MENKENEYFTKKEILERLKWLVIAICCLNVLITISLIVFFLYYNPNLLLSILSAIILGFFGTKLYKKYKK
jgi:uncharacterized membrane-anchored protein YitT (DUF2179 family)